MKGFFDTIDSGGLMVVVFVVAAGCGGAAKPDSTAMAMEGQKHEMGQMGEAGEKGEMASMPPQIAKFHDTLAPRWHAPHGPQRMADTCAAITQLRADADAIATAQPPSGGDAERWSAGGKQLTLAVAALDTTCKANDATAFEPAFERVHETFHHLMEAASAHHDEPGKHGEHEPGKH
jgi:hypothetical protein